MGKVLGYTLIIAIFVAAAYFLAVGQKGGDKKTQEKQVDTVTDVSVTPTGVYTRISVYAAGTMANNEYPTMELRMDGVMVKTWKGVTGDPRVGKFDEFVYDFPGVISGQTLQVAYTNDFYVAADEDRNLYVDRIVVGTSTYVADSPATLTTTLDKTNKTCSDGKTLSRWLLCNGHFTFQPYDYAFIPAPTPVARLIEGSMIKIYAGGKFIGGDFPKFDLLIKNQPVATFKVAGDQNLRILGEYSFLHWEKIKISDISVAYMNDWYDKTGGDRNLMIDRINLDGVDYFADSSSVYQTGIWRNEKCTEGYLRSKLMWCPGATMKFGARALHSPTPTPKK